VQSGPDRGSVRAVKLPVEPTMRIGVIAAMFGVTKGAVRRWVDQEILASIPGHLPGERLFLLSDVEGLRERLANRVCEGCGGQLPAGATVSQRFCSDRCRDGQWMRRKREAAKHLCECGFIETTSGLIAGQCQAVTGQRVARGHQFRGMTVDERTAYIRPATDAYLAKPKEVRDAQSRANMAKGWETMRAEGRTPGQGNRGKKKAPEHAAKLIPNLLTNKELAARHGGKNARTWLARRGGKANSGKQLSDEHKAKIGAAHARRAQQVDPRLYEAQLRLRKDMTPAQRLALAREYDPTLTAQEFFEKGYVTGPVKTPVQLIARTLARQEVGRMDRPGRRGRRPKLVAADVVADSRVLGKAATARKYNISRGHVYRLLQKPSTD